MDRIFWQRQVHSGADAEVGIRGVNALQLDCVQHILGRQVRPLEEKRTAVPAGKLKKSPGFCAVPEEVRVIKKANNGKNKSNLYIKSKKCFEKLLSFAEGMQTKLCILPKIKTFRCTVETHLNLC